MVPRTADGWQPLCAVYARRLRVRVRRRIESGHLKVQDLLGAVRVRELGPDEIASIDPDGRGLGSGAGGSLEPSPLRLEPRLAHRIVLAAEVQLSVDEDPVGHRGEAERVVRPDREIGILPDLD